jgi:ribosomal protein S18 acetylase RimI-like enzyme
VSWRFRPLVAADLPELLVLQERGAVLGLAEVFDQAAHPFPRDDVLDRWSRELDDESVAAYVATDGDDRIVGFAARREDELLHFGTAVATWGSGLAAWLHDELVATFPAELVRLRLWVFADNHRGRRFYRRLGWSPTGRETRSGFAPYPLLLEHALDRGSGQGDESARPDGSG